MAAADTTGKTPFDLKNVEVAIAVDFSGTMRTKDTPTGLTRLAAVEEVATALAAELEKFDDDGITVVKFASKVRMYDGVTHTTLANVFKENRPMGNTNTRDAVSDLVDKFLDKRVAKGDIKPACIIVFTDGVPDDRVGLAQVIVNATKRIKSRKELGILFVQVGNDPDAATYLDKLNNHLEEAGAEHDIVAVCKLEDLEDMSEAEIVETAFTD